MFNNQNPNNAYIQNTHPNGTDQFKQSFNNNMNVGDMYN